MLTRWSSSRHFILEAWITFWNASNGSRNKQFTGHLKRFIFYAIVMLFLFFFPYFFLILWTLKLTIFYLTSSTHNLNIYVLFAVLSNRKSSIRYRLLEEWISKWNERNGYGNWKPWGDSQHRKIIIRKKSLFPFALN